MASCLHLIMTSREEGGAKNGWTMHSKEQGLSPAHHPHQESVTRDLPPLYTN